MVKSYTFKILMHAVPKARPRIYKGRALMPEKYTEAKRVISAIAKSKIKAPLSGEIKLSIIFSFQNKVHGDLDNLAGTVMDALNKIAYKDDKQIYYLETVRIYSEDPESVTVTVSESDE